STQFVRGFVTSCAEWNHPDTGRFAGFPGDASVMEPEPAVPEPVGDWTKAAATPPARSTLVAWEKLASHPLWLCPAKSMVVTPAVEPAEFAPNSVSLLTLTLIVLIAVQATPLPLTVGWLGVLEPTSLPTNSTSSPDTGGVHDTVAKEFVLAVLQKSGIVDEPSLTKAIGGLASV